MRRASRAPLAAAALALVALAVGGCSGAAPPAAVGGAASGVRDGGPPFVLLAAGAVRDGETGVEVDLGVPRTSLVFRQSGDAAVAVARWTVTVEGPGGPRTVSPVDTVRAGSPEALRDPTPAWRRVRVEAPPGDYRVRAVLEDRAGGQTAERTAEVRVLAPGGTPTLGDVRLEAGGPLDPASVPAGLDSARAAVQAAGVPEGASARLTVVRFPTDAAPALPLTAATPGFGSLARLGVDPTRADTVATAPLPLAAGPVADLSGPLPVLDPGVYLVAVTLADAEGGPLAAADRVVVVRRADYPVPSRVGDLIAPLAYLATPREMARLTGAAPAAQRQAFDRFWGDQLDDRRLAAATVRAYYERVEEANRRFATYKDGWKTDPGMAYVLFGPPRYVEPTLDGERWSYPAGGAAPPVLTFERAVTPLPGGRRVEVLTLLRDRAYGESLARARRQWRSGVVP